MSEKRAESRPEISIIVPVYKVERYLNECIDSILAQTFTDFELILVDDGSPDGCPALCRLETDVQLMLLFKCKILVRKAGDVEMRLSETCLLYTSRCV